VLCAWVSAAQTPTLPTTSSGFAFSSLSRSTCCAFGAYFLIANAPKRIRLQGLFLLELAWWNFPEKFLCAIFSRILNLIVPAFLFSSAAVFIRAELAISHRSEEFLYLLSRGSTASFNRRPQILRASLYSHIHCTASFSSPCSWFIPIKCVVSTGLFRFLQRLATIITHAARGYFPSNFRTTVLCLRAGVETGRGAR